MAANERRKTERTWLIELVRHDLHSGEAATSDHLTRAACPRITLQIGARIELRAESSGSVLDVGGAVFKLNSNFSGTELNWLGLV